MVAVRAQFVLVFHAPTIAVGALLRLRRGRSGVTTGTRNASYDPAGRVARTIMLPVAQPTCPMFGGRALDIMFVTSASIGLGAEARAAQPQAGSLFAVAAGVRGLPEARFRG